MESNNWKDELSHIVYPHLIGDKYLELCDFISQELEKAREEQRQAGIKMLASEIHLRLKDERSRILALIEERIAEIKERNKGWEVSSLDANRVSELEALKEKLK